MDAFFDFFKDAALALVAVGAVPGAVSRFDAEAVDFVEVIGAGVFVDVDGR